MEELLSVEVGMAYMATNKSLEFCLRRKLEQSSGKLEEQSEQEERCHAEILCSL